MNLKKAKTQLLEWYAHNKRDLPWRLNRDPYRIWISETMLQQTTTTAVIPYFERFVERFPTLEALATSPVEHVLEAWSGLGYYSRARNLHKSAQALNQAGGFPRSFKELIEFPGFGPYTSRSVASLAFDESVGVVDGNVIRVFARVFGRDWQWWKSQEREEIQRLADSWVEGVSSYAMNQAVMELGRVICTPKSPSCLLCPLCSECVAYKSERVNALPLPKPRRAREIWVWEPEVRVVGARVLLDKSEDVPFLRGHWKFPGFAAKVKAKPKQFDYKHSITHHDIYVTVKPGYTAKPQYSVQPEKDRPQGTWVAVKEIRKYAQTSLVDKALSHWNARRSDSEHVQNKRKTNVRRS